MKIIYMGTPEFAVLPLVKLMEAGHDIAAVVTQPDKPKGRGNKVQYPAVKEKAIENNIFVLQPEKVKNNVEFLDQLKVINPDCIVVAAYGKILPKEVLDLPKYGCINIHGSLLPKYRGAAPIQWAVINGDEKTGITTMKMDVGLDTGDMIDKREVTIGKMTAGELHDALSQLGADLICETLSKLENGMAVNIKQNEAEATYAPMLSKQDGLIDFNKKPNQIESQVRGLNPWPIAYTMYKGIPMKVWETESLEEPNNLPSGTITSVSKEGIKVSAGGKTLLIKKIQFPNKKMVTVDEYLRGNQIETNIKLGIEVC